MFGPFTIDASVFLNAFNVAETGHGESARFFDELQRRATPMFAPTLLLPEVAAALSRGQPDSGLALTFANKLAQLPHLFLIALDTSLANQATQVAAEHRLRGSDAVYVAVALQFGTPLITLDREQKERVRKIVTAQTPAEALKTL